MRKKRLVFLGVLFVLFLSDCTPKEQAHTLVLESQSSNENSLSSQTPPPGTMVLVSKEKVILKSVTDLIRAGDFYDSWSHRGSPEGFTAPDKESGFSFIDVELDPRVKGFPVRQTWSKGVDGGQNVFKLFHTEFTQLKPQTRYRFSCSAKSLSKGSFRVSAWQVTNAGSPQEHYDRLAWEIVCISPSNEFKDYSGEFTTLPGQKFTVVLCASARNDVTSFPATVIWRYWHLIEVRP